jgi:hypothetical protein
MEESNLSKNPAEILSILKEILDALKEINNSQKAATVVLREIKSELSHPRR